jgi:hypothetical protein
MLNKEEICVIIGSYPQNHMDTTIVSLTIESFKRRGYDICLVSHAPLSSELQKASKYFIYSDENEILNFPEPSSITSFFANSEIHYKTNWGNKIGAHSLAILRNMKNALYLLKNKKYKSFIYAECDTVLNSEDHKLLESKLEEISFNEKDYWLMIENATDNMIVPVTSLFGGNIDYFNNVFEQIDTEEDYLNICKLTSSYTLESLFSVLFCRNVSQNGYLDYTKPRDLFTSKWLGISNYGKIDIPEFENEFDVDIEIVKNKNSNDQVYYVLYFNPKNELINIKFYTDNIIFKDFEITTGALHYWVFDVNETKTWKMEVYYNNKLLKTLERTTEEIFWNVFSYFEIKTGDN